MDRAGNLVIGDSDNSRIRVVAGSTGTFYGQAMTKGDIYTIAGNGTQGFTGDGGPATSAELNTPCTPALDAAGNLVFADNQNQRVRVVAESTGTFYGQAMTEGDIYTIAGNGTLGFSGDGGPATSAEFQNPVGVTVDSAGNVVIGDGNNNRVRVIAGSTGTLLRPGHDHGRHLHDRRQRHPRLLRRWRPGHERRTRRAERCGGRRCGQPGDRRTRSTTGSGWSRPAPARSTAGR